MVPRFCCLHDDKYMNINSQEAKRSNVILVVLTLSVSLFVIGAMFLLGTGQMSSFLISGLDSIRTNCADLISIVVDTPGAFL